jgi:hypothetical protein
MNEKEQEIYESERLDHLGIVAAACQEIGVAEYLDRQQPDLQRQVSMGTATVAMILNGLVESLRRLYLVPQFFEHKPVEHSSSSLAIFSDEIRNTSRRLLFVR